MHWGGSRGRHPAEEAHTDGKKAHALDHPQIAKQEALDNQQWEHSAGLRTLDQPQAPPHFSLLVRSHACHLRKIHHLPRHRRQKLKGTNKAVVGAVENEGGNHGRPRHSLGGGALRLRRRPQAGSHGEPHGQVRNVHHADPNEHTHDVSWGKTEGVQPGQHYKPDHQIGHKVTHGDDPEGCLGLLHIKETPANFPEHLMHQGQGHIDKHEVDPHRHHWRDVEQEFQAQHHQPKSHLKIHTHGRNTNPARHRGNGAAKRWRHQADHQGGGIDVLRGEVGQKQTVSGGYGQADPGCLPQQRHREERN
mmetsp:Transcript_97039/g.222369  ORF Transcript_97039/g.222369 Transcript_97039/m.222369 type:complete len:305 (-) Transcript_97039:54-968(-)